MPEATGVQRTTRWDKLTIDSRQLINNQLYGKKIKLDLECHYQSCNCHSICSGRCIRTKFLHEIDHESRQFLSELSGGSPPGSSLQRNTLRPEFPGRSSSSLSSGKRLASIGYHFYITRDGEVHVCRPVHQIGAHATGWNDKSVGICYEGGLNEDGQPADTRTYAQKCSLLDLLRQLKTDYPKAKILGHYQLSRSVHKACPCFDAKSTYSEL